MKLMIFNIGQRKYALEVSQVCEVIRLTEITPVSDVADFVEGVIKLREDVIPVINLRKRFNIESKELNKFDRIIITKVNLHLVGIIADSVDDIVTLAQENISPSETFLKESEYLISVGTIDEDMIFILDMNKLVTDKQKMGVR
jgi:purine-binding chemotaxis protein CheW